MSKHSPSIAHRTSAQAVASAMLLAACLTSDPRGVALYPGAPRERNAVAMLVGEVGYVDGQNVSWRGSTFELLPGCHVVTTRRRYGKVEPGWPSLAVARDVSFVLHMQANHSYLFGYPSSEGLTVDAREKDALGTTVRVLVPNTDPEAARRCLAESAVTTRQSAVAGVAGVAGSGAMPIQLHPTMAGAAGGGGLYIVSRIRQREGVTDVGVGTVDSSERSADR